MRFFISAAVFVAFGFITCSACADDTPATISWKVGSVGQLPLKKGEFHVVMRVLAPGEAIVIASSEGARANGERVVLNAGDPFIVKGVKTAGLKPDSVIRLSDKFKVTGEKILNGAAYGVFDGASIWVLELQK